MGTPVLAGENAQLTIIDMKITGIISSLLLLILLSNPIFSQEADQNVKQLLSSHDYLTLEQQFPSLENKMQDAPLKWIAKTMLDIRLNRLNNALNALDTILISYQPEIGMDQSLELAYTYFSLLEELEEYERAFNLLQDFLQQSLPHMAKENRIKFSNLQKHLSFLKEEKKTVVTKPANGGEIPLGKFELDIKNQHSDLPGITTTWGIVKVYIAGQEYIFILDTGAEKTILFNHITEAMALKQFEESLTIRGYSGSEIAHLAVLQDSLLLGNINFTNAKILTCDNYLKKSLPDIRGDLNIIGGIIGVDMIKKLGEIQFLPGEKKIVVPHAESEMPDFGKNIFFDVNNFLNVQASLNNEPACLLIDTGCDITQLLRPYYLKREEKIKSNYEKNRVINLHLDLAYSEFYQMPQLQLKIANSTVSMDNVPVYPDTLNANQDIEGLLGIDFIFRCEKVTLNMHKMFINIE